MAGLGAHGFEPSPEDWARASVWPVLFVIRETGPEHARGPDVPQAHLICTACTQSVICLSPDAGSAADGYLSAGYLIRPADVTARTLAHIRQCHDAPPAPVL